MPSSRPYFTAQSGERIQPPELWGYDGENEGDQALERARSHPDEAMWQHPEYQRGQSYLQSRISMLSPPPPTPSWVQAFVKTCPGVTRLKSRNGSIPLHSASMLGKLETLQVLYNADSTSARETIDTGETALHLAVTRLGYNYDNDNTDKDHKGVVEFLIQMCPDLLNVKCNRGQTPIDLAEERLALLDLIISTGASSDPQLNEEDATDKSIEATREIHFNHSYCDFSDEIDSHEDENELYKSIVQMEHLDWSAEQEQKIRSLVEKHPDHLAFKIGKTGPFGETYIFDTPLLKALSTDAPLDLLEYFIEQCPSAVSVRDAAGTFPLHQICHTMNIDGPASHYSFARRILQRETRGKRMRYSDYCPWLQFTERVLDLYPEAAIMGDFEGQTPLFLALQRYAPYPLVNLLCKKCPDAVVIQRNGGETPLKLAVAAREKYLMVRDVARKINREGSSADKA